MQVKDFFWNYFQQTGGIEAYLAYREIMEKEQQQLSMKAASDEE
ncbi:MAG: YqzL family protein [Clostridia bacterium]|nr:YqzL family protein [Clostridia bacterium]